MIWGGSSGCDFPHAFVSDGILNSLRLHRKDVDVCRCIQHKYHLGTLLSYFTLHAVHCNDSCCTDEPKSVICIFADQTAIQLQDQPCAPRCDRFGLYNTPGGSFGGGRGALLSRGLWAPP